MFRYCGRFAGYEDVAKEVMGRLVYAISYGASPIFPSRQRYVSETVRGDECPASEFCVEYCRPNIKQTHALKL